MKKLLTLVLQPAISLMSRLNYFRRFATLGVMALIAISVVLFNLFVSLNQTIQTLEKECAGIELVENISKNIQLLQQHRELSAGLLGGVGEMAKNRAAKESELQTALANLEHKLSASLVLSDEWIEIRADIQKLFANGLTISVDENYEMQTRIIEQLLTFESNLTDEYDLILDTEISTYYLIDTTVRHLPEALETIGEIRALGTGILAKKTLTDDEAVSISVLVAQRNSALKELELNLKKATRYNPAMHSLLSGVFTNIDQATRQVIGIVTSDILKKKFLTHPDAFFETTTLAIDKSYQQMYQSLLPATKKLLEQRLARAKYILYLCVGIALLLFVVVSYFACGIYFSITQNIYALVSAAHAFAKGDFNQRVQLNTHDELRQISKSFNEMADGFVSLLATRNEDDAKLRAIFNSSLDAMVQINSAGKITGWNNQAVTIFGWSTEEAMGQKLDEMIVPHRYRQEHLDGMQRFLDTGEGAVMNLRFEISALHKSGREFPIEMYINPLKLAEKYEFIAFIHDISARKHSEEKLQLANMVYQHSIEGIFLTDANNRIIAANPAFTEITGYSLAEIEGKNPRLFKSGLHNQEFYQAMWQEINEKGHWQGEVWDRRKNGEIHAKFLSINSIFNQDGKIHRYLALFSDITAHKQYEEEIKRLSSSELNKAKLDAEKANRAKSDFLSSMSHELRTPMNAVLGFAQLLESEDLTEDQHDSVKEILTAGHHLLDLINEVLDLSKIEAEKLDLALEKVDIKALVQNCLSLAQPLTIKNNVTIIDNSCANCHGAVIADRLRLKQVLLNLISNAVKYNRQGGRVTISCEVINRQTLRINVTDTGHGLSAIQLGKLFNPFERLTAKNSNIEGTGIGLVISKKMIEAMNGKIGVNSTEGIGSCFWIEIPQP